MSEKYNEILAKQTESLEIPAFLINGEGKIAYKNEAAKRSKIPFRVGAHLKKYISGSDMNKIIKAEYNVPFAVSLCFDRSYNCIAQRSGDGYLLKVLSLSALSMYRLSQLSEYTAEKVQTYAILVNSLIGYSGKAEISAEAARKLTCIIKFQSRMNDYIKLSENIHRGAMLIATTLTPLKIVTEAINNALPHHTVEFCADYEEDGICDRCIDINKSDFYSLITYLVSFAVRYLCGSNIKITLDRYENNAIYFVEGETKLDENDAKAICSLRLDKPLPSGNGDLIFSALLSKMLAEHYGWRYEFVPSGIGFSRLKALLSIPLSENEDIPFVLHSPKDDIVFLGSLMKYEFADL